MQRRNVSNVTLLRVNTNNPKSIKSFGTFIDIRLSHNLFSLVEQMYTFEHVSNHRLLEGLSHYREHRLFMHLKICQIVQQWWREPCCNLSPRGNWKESGFIRSYLFYHLFYFTIAQDALSFDWIQTMQSLTFEYSNLCIFNLYFLEHCIGIANVSSTIRLFFFQRIESQNHISIQFRESDPNNDTEEPWIFALFPCSNLMINGIFMIRTTKRSIPWLFIQIWRFLSSCRWYAWYLCWKEVRRHMRTTLQ